MPAITIRKPIVAAVALALVGGVLAAAAMAPGLWAQDEGEEPGEQPAAEEGAAPEPIAATREERLTVGDLELQVDGLFTGTSPERPGYTEVRVALTVHNVGPAPLGYLLDGFSGVGPYPAISMIDGAGVEHSYRLADGTGAALPGSTLTMIPQGLTGRWTVGFEVPTVYDDELTLRVAQGDLVVDYDLATKVNLDGWDPPAGIEVFEIGDEIPWGDEFVLTPFDHGNLVCGDPATQLVTQVFTVGVQVGNRSTVDAVWPGVRFPQEAAVAQWADGGSARLSSETFASGSESLIKWAQDAVTVPPAGSADGIALATYPRAMMFGVPRDGRLGLVEESPQGILLNRPDGTQAWLELGGSGNMSINPQFCDTGNFDFALPYAFAPGATFEVGRGGAPFDAKAADATARQLLSEALVVAGLFFEDHETFSAMTAGELAARWDGISFTNGFSSAAVGTVSVVTKTEGDPPVVSGVLATESESGTVFCVTASDEGELTFGEGEDIAAAEETCIALEEAQGDEEATTTTTTTTTTVP